MGRPAGGRAVAAGGVQSLYISSGVTDRYWDFKSANSMHKIEFHISLSCIEN